MCADAIYFFIEDFGFLFYPAFTGQGQILLGNTRNVHLGESGVFLR